MKLYIIEEVLSDYTCGMCVIAAENLKQCREIFVEEFSSEWSINEYDESIQNNSYQELDVVNVNPGMISHVHGGG
jgi:predicted DsbA family dithiol-disulfide isomerase